MNDFRPLTPPEPTQDEIDSKKRKRRRMERYLYLMKIMESMIVWDDLFATEDTTEEEELYEAIQYISAFLERKLNE